MIPNAERCSKAGTRNWHPWRCPRRGIVERDGYRYCKQHDPEAVKARRDASAARWNAESDRRHAAWAREQRTSAARDTVIAAARKLVRSIQPHHWQLPSAEIEELRVATRALDEAEKADST